MPVEIEVVILRERAAKAREIAENMNDEKAVAGLLRYAEEQEAKADELEANPLLPDAAAIPSGEPPIARAGAAMKPEVPSEPEPPENDAPKTSG